MADSAFPTYALTNLFFEDHLILGDQDGLMQPLALSYSTLTFNPLAFITQILCLPPRLVLKTRYLPSGDQEGDSWSMLSKVSCTGLLPSSFAVNIWKRPFVNPSYAILPPLGDQDGDVL
jgi:hypothetical protein